MSLPRDPTPGAITYEKVPITGGYNVERVCDDGGNASLYRSKIGTPDSEFADLIIAALVAHEGGTAI